MICISLFFVACQKADISTDFPQHAVNLSDLKVGQVSQFVRYTASCNDFGNDFSWSGDTLNLRVVEEGTQLYLEESLTPFSNMYLGGIFQDPIRYPVEVKEGKLSIPDRANSALFFFYGSDILHLTTPSNNKNILWQEGCKLSLKGEIFTGDEIGKIFSFKIGSIQVSNKTAVSCVPVLLGVDAYLMYDSHQLFLSHVITGEVFNGHLSEYIQGWYLLEK